MRLKDFHWIASRRCLDWGSYPKRFLTSFPSWTYAWKSSIRFWALALERNAHEGPYRFTIWCWQCRLLWDIFPNRCSARRYRGCHLISVFSLFFVMLVLPMSAVSLFLVPFVSGTLFASFLASQVSKLLSVDSEPTDLLQWKRQIRGQKRWIIYLAWFFCPIVKKYFDHETKFLHRLPAHVPKAQNANEILTVHAETKQKFKLFILDTITHQMSISHKKISTKPAQIKVSTSLKEGTDETLNAYFVLFRHATILRSR